MELFQKILSPFIFILYYLGSEGFYILLFPLIFWCMNKSIGKRVFILVLLSGFTGVLLKEFSINSGYYIGIFILWSYFFTLSTKISTKIFSLIIIMITIVSGFSQGILSIFELMISLLLGIILLVLFLILEPRIKDLCNQKYSISQRIFLVVFFIAAASVLLVLVGVSDILIPIAILGSCFGGLIGIIMEKEYIRFSVNGDIIVLLGRYVLGLIFIGLVHYGLELLFNNLNIITPFLHFIRYAITLFIGTYFIPRLFVYVKLAERD